MKELQQDGTATIAVVEDDEPILDAVKLILENQQWNVSAYNCGEAFLVDLNESRPDLLLLDPHLPGINGLEVVEAVSEALVSLPIIVLTAHPNSSLITRLENTDIKNILVKPVTEEVLLDNVRMALATAVGDYSN